MRYIAVDTTGVLASAGDPRLCRAGSSSLTFPGVHRGSSNVSSHAHERNLTDGRLREPKPHDMDLQISCGVHSEMSAQAAVSGPAPISGRGLPEACAAERVESRGRAFDARPCPHAVVDSAKIRGVAGRRVYQGQECDPLRAGLWRAQAQLRRAAFLGKGGSSSTRSVGTRRPSGLTSATKRGRTRGSNK